MDSILSDEPSVHTLPETDEPASSDSGTSEASETQAETEASASQPNAGGDDDDVDDKVDPADLRASGLKKALVAERKRAREREKQAKELQRQLDQLTGQVTAIRQQPAQSQPISQPKPEDEYEKFLAEGPKFVRGHVSSELDAFRRQAALERIEDSQAEFSERHADAPEHFATFTQLAAANPALQAEFRAVVDRKHPRYRNPAKFAYDYAKAYAAANEIGDPVSYRERVRAELQAELTGQSPSTSPKSAPAKAPPKTIAGSRGSGVGATQAWRGPRSLNEILK